MDSRNFPSYRLRHAIRVWRIQRYHRRNSLFYPPEDTSQPEPQPSSKDDLVLLPPSDDLERESGG